MLTAYLSLRPLVWSFTGLVFPARCVDIPSLLKSVLYFHLMSGMWMVGTEWFLIHFKLMIPFTEAQKTAAPIILVYCVHTIIYCSPASTLGSEFEQVSYLQVLGTCCETYWFLKAKCRPIALPSTLTQWQYGDLELLHMSVDKFLKTKWYGKKPSLCQHDFVRQ